MKKSHKETSNNKQDIPGTEEKSPVETVEAECPPTAESAADNLATEEQAMNMTDLLNRLDEATLQAEKNKDLYLRTVADLDTYRRKVQREKQELAKFALQPLVEDLLPSVDHLEMAIQASKGADECKSLIVGVEMVCSQIKKTLANFGVEEISAEGKEFDPNFEDCVSHEPNESVAENIVIKVTRAGYKYNGRLLRPASVVVSSGKAKA